LAQHAASVDHRLTHLDAFGCATIQPHALTPRVKVYANDACHLHRQAVVALPAQQGPQALIFASNSL
jgi:hypothetical protein